MNAYLSYAKKIASIFFIIDTKLEIQSASPTLKKYIADADGQSLLDTFRISKPSRIKSYSDISAKEDRLFLLVAKDKSIALRGQFLDIPNDVNKLIFLGAPWAAWISENKPSDTLRTEDFGILDSQLDQLMLLSTQQRNMEELEELAKDLREAKNFADKARKAQADFFAVMSHEMRTPLNGVVTALNLMRADLFSAEDNKMWRIAEQSANNLQHVVDHVLDYSKLQAGGFKNSPIDFDVRELVETVEMMLSTKAKESHSRIITLVDNSLPTTLKADEPKLRQILLNLVSNAVKFTKGGDITIRLKPLDNAKVLFVEVADTGIGIETESLNKIFDPYWTLSNDEATTKGTGLGLKISREFVALLGGELKCRSVSGEGSSFYFELPYEEGQSIAKEATTNTVKRYKGKVLIAEDNLTNQFLGKTVLERRGISVTIANNGLEAIQAVAKEPFDLVFMDISMPHMGGIAATKHLREAYDITTLPIVALTAHADNNDVEQFLATGMNSVLLKPINLKKLDLCLAEHLETLGDTAVTSQAKPSEQKTTFFDPDTARDLVNEVGDNGYRTVAELFLQELNTKSLAIIEAEKNDNLPQIAKLAHSIHSSAIMLGCTELGLTLKNIEVAIKSEQWLAANKLLKGLTPLVTGSRKALKMHLHNSPT